MGALLIEEHAKAQPGDLAGLTCCVCGKPITPTRLPSGRLTPQTTFTCRDCQGDWQGVKIIRNGIDAKGHKLWKWKKAQQGGPLPRILSPSKDGQTISKQLLFQSEAHDRSLVHSFNWKDDSGWARPKPIHYGPSFDESGKPIDGERRELAWTEGFHVFTCEEGKRDRKPRLFESLYGKNDKMQYHREGLRAILARDLDPDPVTGKYGRLIVDSAKHEWLGVTVNDPPSVEDFRKVAGAALVALCEHVGRAERANDGHWAEQQAAIEDVEDDATWERYYALETILSMLQVSQQEREVLDTLIQAGIAKRPKKDRPRKLKSKGGGRETFSPVLSRFVTAPGERDLFVIVHNFFAATPKDERGESTIAEMVRRGQDCNGEATPSPAIERLLARIQERWRELPNKPTKLVEEFLYPPPEGTAQRGEQGAFTETLRARRAIIDAEGTVSEFTRTEPWLDAYQSKVKVERPKLLTRSCSVCGCLFHHPATIPVRILALPRLLSNAGKGVEAEIPLALNPSPKTLEFMFAGFRCRTVTRSARCLHGIYDPSLCVTCIDMGDSGKIRVELSMDEREHLKHVCLGIPYRHRHPASIPL